MPTMKYYKEEQQKKQQDKHARWQQQEIARSDEAMQQSISQISCRTLNYCRNGDTKYCMYCKWNKTCIAPRDDYYKPIIPDLKVLP